ncbi:MAG: hypothetical protein KAW17_05385, partial [Candidatus Eisenbacteria sp.]|nr:hypothetical protein [Candidatus Eisenbacteria bacterium]
SLLLCLDCVRIHPDSCIVQAGVLAHLPQRLRLVAVCCTERAVWVGEARFGLKLKPGCGNMLVDWGLDMLALPV